jgi:hypothetical protein
MAEDERQTALRRADEGLTITPAPRPSTGGDWESSPRRHRFLAFLFIWMGVTTVYMAAIFFAMAAVPPEARDWLGIGMFVFYLVVCTALLLVVAFTEPRRRS